MATDKRIVMNKKTEELPKSNPALGFVEGIRQEARKITWPSRKELYGSTKIVLIMTFVLGFSIYFIDIGMRSALNGLDVIFYWMLGR